MDALIHNTVMKMGAGDPSRRPFRARLVGGSTQGSACRLHPGLRLLSPLRGCSGWGFFGLHRSAWTAQPNWRLFT